MSGEETAKKFSFGSDVFSTTSSECLSEGPGHSLRMGRTCFEGPGHSAIGGMGEEHGRMD